MKKISKLILSVFMCASMVACSSGNGGETGKYTAGTYGKIVSRETRINL